ncbi:hypothetical protein LVW35_27855 [Pseudomonas sp. HN11]|uniref:hypothetical protein n=1 Tax=Pseudomonas sp. HN11 TaxID=1344094 RepID=UPI001F461B2F|nr:hypothetical protein [Pseudomonas sp. HN11]UII71398.1 hypothetical protein LVW35_27855 [Pseudomonas sp. HN11]
MSDNKWWEKTVEWLFVTQAALSHKLDFAAPLSGKNERTAGDAIFGQNSKLVLVEFKATENDVKTEKSLFMNFVEAQEALQEFEHHFVVFAEELASMQQAPKLELHAQLYFGSDIDLPALEILHFAADKTVFDDYLKRLSAFKYPDGRGGGSGHVSPELMGAVVGVDTSGKITGVASLQEYAPTLAPPALTQTPTQTPTNSNKLGLKGPR